MNIQIFTKSKSFDCKKAERYFKERGIPFQTVDLLRYGLSNREFDAVLQGIGGIDNLIDWNVKNQQITNMKYTDSIKNKEDILFENPELMKVPIVRCGRSVTVGYCPEIWKEWI